MTFAQKLKELRTRAGMSQEKLAERVGVSRQAITKWETDKGAPEMENLLALSDLFGVSVDELLGRESRRPTAGYLYESVTEYDVADPKRYDVKLGGARRLTVRGYEGEKLRVRLLSDTLSTLEADCKVRIDDSRGRLDVDLQRLNGLTEAAAREGLTIELDLPNRYINHVELAVNVNELTIGELAAEELETAKAKEAQFRTVIRKKFGETSLTTGRYEGVLEQSMEAIRENAGHLAEQLELFDDGGYTELSSSVVSGGYRKDGVDDTLQEERLRHYRERIRTYGLASATTGTSEMYEKGACGLPFHTRNTPAAS